MNAAAENHAEQNACGWLETICALVAALECDYDRLQELRDERDAWEPDPDDEGAPKTWAEECTDAAEELAELEAAATYEGEQIDAERARERIQESPLSVQVRSGWTDPGADMEAEEFEILLSTGGPALRIRGELNEHKEPHRAWLEYQDWGTPWTEKVTTDSHHDALMTFCQQFYFGE